MRRVAVSSSGPDVDSSDEEESGTVQKMDDSMETEDVLFANVFDDGMGSIAERVSKRRSSARMSEGSALAVTPAKEGITPRKRVSSAKKVIRVIKESGVDKENETSNRSVDKRKSRSVSKKKARASDASATTPLRTLHSDESLQESSKDIGNSASSSSKSGDRNDSNVTMALEESARPWSLEDFGVGKSIGRGKFGNVYSARQKMPKDKAGKRMAGSGPHVALKVLFKAPMVAAKCVHNLRREVEIQSRLKHPNIVQLYGYFDDAKSVYLILQYINGGEVYKHVKRNYIEGRVDEWLCRTIVHDVLSALTHMHARHVYHRDIKAENLLLCSQENSYGDQTVRVCLGDFGWAVHAPPPNTTRFTMCGTPEYLSPEMLSGQGHERHVDLWSTGVLMFELLTGTTPFVLYDEEEEAARSRKAARDSSGDEDLEHEAESEQSRVFARISKHTFGAIDISTAVDTHESGISPEATVFINALLHPEPTKRPEAQQALDQSWMMLESIKRAYSL